MSDTINFLNVARYVSNLERQISKSGITLELRTDFGYLVRLCETLPDKPSPTAMFNPLHHHIGPGNGFWIKGTSQDGEVVHVQAVRFDDLTGTNLAREFEDLTAFYHDPVISAEVGETCLSRAPITRAISGKVCYHGEMWLRGGEHGYRGQDLPSLLSRFILAIAASKWSPDFVYGFGYDMLIKNGVMLSYGYWHMQPSAVLWHRPNRPKPLDVWLVWLTAKDLRDLIEHHPEPGWHFQQKFQKDTPTPRIHPEASTEAEGADKPPTVDRHLVEV